MQAKIRLKKYQIFQAIKISGHLMRMMNTILYKQVGDIWTATLGKTRQSNQRLLMGNYYRTREEAEQALDFQTRKAKLIKEIEDSSDVINWEDTNHVKYHIWIDRRDNLLRVDGFVYLQDQGATYTTNIVFLEELIKERSDEVKELLFGIKS